MDVTFQNGLFPAFNKTLLMFEAELHLQEDFLTFPLQNNSVPNIVPVALYSISLHQTILNWIISLNPIIS